MKHLLIAFIFISLFLISCSNDSTENLNEKDKVPSQSSITFTHDKQTFQIIPLYEEVLDYTSLVKSDPSKNNKQEYFKKVVEPFQKIVAEKNVDIQSNYYSRFAPTTNVKQLEKNTIKLLKQQKQINDYIKESIHSSAKLLKGGHKTFFIMPLNPEDTFTIEELKGVGGITFSQDVVLLQIDPSFTENELKYTIAHEYHHTIAMESRGEASFKLLDSIILEGKADSFATMVYPDKKVPWIEPLSDESEKIVLEELKKNRDLFDYKIYNDLLNGDYSKGIPPWSNYKMGYEITQSYLKNHPHVSIQEWTKLNAIEILQGSDFRERLN